MEPQTLKLFDVCRHRGLPVITFVNKWDRPGREALGPLDEIEQRLGIVPTPVTWPVGIAGHFEGLIDRRDPGHVIRYSRTAGGATAAGEERVAIDGSAAAAMTGLVHAAEELELLGHIGANHDDESFRTGLSTPVFHGAAVSNIGVKLLLDAIVDLAPAPAPRLTIEGEPVPLDGEFSGLVFKVQANMDPAHRDRIAFVRVCSGVFERGMMLTHVATGRPFATKYAHSLLGRERTSVERAYPGDVVGLVNAGALHPGDTLTEGKPLRCTAWSTSSTLPWCSTLFRTPSCDARIVPARHGFRRRATWRSSRACATASCLRCSPTSTASIPSAGSGPR